MLRRDAKHRAALAVRSCVRVVIAPLGLALLVAGCQPMTRPDRVESAPQPPRQPGYVAAQRYATTSLNDTWTLAGEPVEIALLRPSGRGAFPLVIYLPGLGQPASAGAAWRQAWAQAGYAVLAYQSVASGEAVWASAQARSGDFHDLAKAQFSREALASRLSLLRSVFDELDRRQRSGELAGIDTSRIALAGFELGAQTVMGAAGEAGSDLEPFALPAAVKCVIAFSPYVDAAGGGIEQRYSRIRLPVLSVTSTEDSDPYGLVTAPATRRIPFDHMPSGQKYLLSLAGAPHSLISGRETPAAEDNSPATQGSPRTKSGGGAGQGGGSGRHRAGNGGAQGGRNSDASNSSPNPSTPRPVASAAWTAELGQAQGVTTAYLDASVANDAVAQEWLTRDARRWLADTAELIVK